MKKQFYLKPEIYLINAEPEMLLAGSPISTGEDDTDFSEDGFEHKTFGGGSWTTSN